MKSINKLSFALAAALLAAPFASFAQDAEEPSSPWSFSAAVTSDYVWRGTSQTLGDPALQAGLTWTSPVGIYAGVWGSNVDFGEDSADFELDGFIGYNVDFSDNINFDVMYNEYTYPSYGGSNFGELITKTTFFDHYSLTLAGSTNEWATHENGYYAGLGTDWDLPAGFSISASVGRSGFSDKSGLEDYTDYGVSLSKSYGPATFSLGYFGNDIKKEDVGDNALYHDVYKDRVVFTVSVAAP